MCNVLAINLLTVLKSSDQTQSIPSKRPPNSLHDSLNIRSTEAPRIDLNASDSAQDISAHTPAETQTYVGGYQSSLCAFAQTYPEFPHRLPIDPLVLNDFNCQASTNTASRDTTLCSTAYELVSQHNNKGIDMIEIGIRLSNGFRKGDGDSGCRVENKLLFDLLDDISG